MIFKFDIENSAPLNLPALLTGSVVLCCLLLLLLLTAAILLLLD